MLTSVIQLGWREIVSDIPRDAGAIVVYVLLILFIGVVWYGSTKGKRSAESSAPEETSRKSSFPDRPTGKPTDQP